MSYLAATLGSIAAMVAANPTEYLMSELNRIERTLTDKQLGLIDTTAMLTAHEQVGFELGWGKSVV